MGSRNGGRAGCEECLTTRGEARDSSPFAAVVNPVALVVSITTHGGIHDCDRRLTVGERSNWLM